MRRMTAGMRIAIVLTMWSATTLLTLRLCGVFDDGFDEQIAARTRLSETVAVACSEMASREQFDSIDATLSSLVSRNPDVLSAGLRDADGRLTKSFGQHELLWSDGVDQQLSNNCIYVPMMEGTRSAGRVEFSFRPLVRTGITGFLQISSVRTLLLTIVANFVIFAWCLHYCLRSLDPSQVVPDRVRSALDTIAEGLVIIDDEETIVLTNDAFAKMLGRPKDELQGMSLADVPWELHATEDSACMPWHLPASPKGAAKRAAKGSGAPTKIQLHAADRLWTMMADAAPIHDDQGNLRGKLISLNDITMLEQNRAQLQSALEALEASQQEIRERNEQLEYLATRDPMTGCLNRRSFFDAFDEQWKAARRYDYPLSCVMVDVDHFKSINDTHGHATGDQVLTEVARQLLATARDTDYVCRYGGEEFCVLLPHVDVEGARQAAERFRSAIAEITILDVTASLGVSDRSYAAETPEAMLDQADQCLYRAKRNGRNQVVTFPRVLEDSGSAEDQRLLAELNEMNAEAKEAGAANVRKDKGANESPKSQ